MATEEELVDLNGQVYRVDHNYKKEGKSTKDINKGQVLEAGGQDFKVLSTSNDEQLGSAIYREPLPNGGYRDVPYTTNDKIMTDKLRQRALLEENYDDDKRKYQRQKESILEKEYAFKRERSRLMENVYSLMPQSSHDLQVLDNRLYQLNKAFLLETERAMRLLEDEAQVLNSSFNTALNNLK